MSTPSIIEVLAERHGCVTEDVTGRKAYCRGCHGRAGNLAAAGFGHVASVEAERDEARAEELRTTPAEPDADERERLARVVLSGLREAWRDDYSALSVAEGVADALIANGYSRTPDAHLAAAKAEALEAFSRLEHEMAMAWGGDLSWLTTGSRVAALVADWAREEAACLREQGGE